MSCAKRVWCNAPRVHVNTAYVLTRQVSLGPQQHLLVQQLVRFQCIAQRTFQHSPCAGHHLDDQVRRMAAANQKPASSACTFTIDASMESSIALNCCSSGSMKPTSSTACANAAGCLRRKHLVQMHVKCIPAARTCPQMCRWGLAAPLCCRHHHHHTRHHRQGLLYKGRGDT
jgi:hypothetical protein